tara:strand:- start:553 stop:882 length:330 start_codon:yes stop_codon:yes gene_type:complete
MSNAHVKRWKKKTWLNVDILYEDEFYARTPDTDKTFPPTIKATYTIVGQNTTRSTLEELPLDPLPETEKKPVDNANPSVDKTFENEVNKNNEETIKENPTMDQSKPPEV